MNTRTTTTTRVGLLLAAAALALTGCASAASPVASPTAERDGQSVTIADAWVKSAESGMSAAFGTLENTSDHDITLVSAESPASTMLQLHETVANDSGAMVMKEKQGGFVIPAGGSFALEPGGNHIMLMDLTAPLAAGDEATFTLTFPDASTYEFTAPVKDYSGANENYEGGDMHMDMTPTPTPSN